MFAVSSCTNAKKVYKNGTVEISVFGSTAFSVGAFLASRKKIDKIVWSTRFRAARRTIVRRDAKSGAEKAKTFNFMQESVRIPTHFPSCGTYKRLIRSACFRFFGPDNFSRPETGRDKKDAESSKIVTSPYKRTAEAIFGGRKSG